MRNLPAGTVTLLFTDIEGSTRWLHELGTEAYAEALAEHQRVLRAAFAAHGGVEVDTQGDAFFVAFPTAPGAIAAAREATEALARGPIRVRIGAHTGTPLRTHGGYVGEDVHLAARVAASAHGGQVVLSRATGELLDEGSFTLIDLGEHRLKDIKDAVAIFQLGDGHFPPLKTIANTNLPRPASSFVGRQRDLDKVVDRVREGARLLTLTGPGGSGKTRLALEVAAALVPDYRAGVFWVGLAAVRDRALVTEAIARTLGARDGLAEHIGDRELLLLIDNLEQVIEAAPELSALVTSCPNLTLLVTSRELLRVQGEVEYPVPPLPIAEAVSLFCERAQISPSDEIAELCSRLDSLPLGIELAAARVKALSPAQILALLSQRLDLLQGGRDADPRQRTLRATFRWSYDLLTEEEQRVLRGLSVCSGGCDLEAATEVTGADLETLQSLVEKSLLRFTDERYWMLETIREYASELVRGAGEAGVANRLHAKYFLRRAESLALAVESYEAGDEARHEVAVIEQENFRTALDWGLDTDPELGLSLAVALEQFWVANNPFEGVRRFASLLAPGADIRLELRARSLRCYGGCLTLSGDWEGAKIQYEKSLDLYQRLGDEWGITHLRHRLATTALSAGDWANARIILEENLARARALGSSYLEGEALGVLGLVEDHDGNVEKGFEFLSRSLELARAVGFRWREAIDLGNLAEISLKLDRAADAEAYGRAALELSLRMDDRLSTVSSLATLALVARARGDATRAGRIWGAIEAEEERAPLGRWDSYRDEFADPLLTLAGPDFESARRNGWHDPLDAAAEYALSPDASE